MMDPPPLPAAYHRYTQIHRYTDTQIHTGMNTVTTRTHSIIQAKHSKRETGGWGRFMGEEINGSYEVLYISIKVTLKYEVDPNPATKES
jgi:hypothetical protein